MLVTALIGAASVAVPFQAPAQGVATLARPVAVAMLAGFFAALVMDVPMRRQSEGMVPAYTAAAAATGRAPDRVREQVARSVHYTAGILAGALFALLALALDALVPPVVALPGAGLAAYAASGVLTLAFLYAFFAHLVLPRFGSETARSRADVVRRQWLRSAAVYVVALSAFVPAARFFLG